MPASGTNCYFIDGQTWYGLTKEGTNKLIVKMVSHYLNRKLIVGKDKQKIKEAMMDD